ncbi:MAG: ABC transporter permease [Bifidobacteriaceae bacterium]|nr:ABC transporter permease [Bifidobacteriaceae bacterium]
MSALGAALGATPAKAAGKAQGPEAKSKPGRRVADLLRPVGQAASVALGVSVVAFFLARIALDDPALVKVRTLTNNYTATDPALVARFQHEFGTDRPLAIQLGDFLLGLARGDLGQSFQYKELSVAELIGAGLGTTLLVAVAAVVSGTLVGVSLGLATATKRSKALDGALRAATTVSLAAPQALVGLVLILALSVWGGWLPAGGWGSGYPENLEYLILPVATLAIGLAPVVFRVTRERAMEVLGESHIEAARSRGLKPWQVGLRHVLPNCAAPVVTVVAMGLGSLLSGAVIVEMVFGIPGIGHVLTEAIHTSDYPVIQAMTLLTGLVIVVCDMAAEMVGRLIDPRLR